MNDLIESAIPLESVPYDPIVNETGDISSMTAEQYLSWVRDQAASMPLIKRCNIDITKYNKNQTKYMPHIDDIPNCLQELIPDKDWKNDIIADFSSLRQLLSDLSLDERYRERKIGIPQLKDKDAWHRFCLADEIDIIDEINNNNNIDNSNDMNNDNIRHDNDEANRENDREILRSKKLKLARKIGLDMQVNDQDNTTNEEHDTNIDNDNPNVNNDDTSEDDGTVEALAVASAVANATNRLKWQGVVNITPSTSLLLQIDQVVTQRLLAYHAEWLQEQSLSVARGKWIYSILAKIDKPLHQDTAAFIRQIYRRCSVLRSKLDLTSSSLEQDLAILNIIIVITGAYFGQSDDDDIYTQKINNNNSEHFYNDDDDDDNDDDDDYDDEYDDDDNNDNNDNNNNNKQDENIEMYTLQKNNEIEEGECD